ncbi:hypothetical protein [Arthrobacter bambusae]|uniref:hypothetical protein n=1 Tax=Arthrobacter bambusae TaxID=1338426 RepID=UPI00278B244F|nr:hypothetical protein [Arthrobacter bambusae]MDQ0241193.1 hypothetical protein [Arthrobacter bambusae]
MKYADLSKYVRILWTAARYGWDLDETYRAWIVGRVLDKLTVAGLMDDDALDQYRDHLAFDYRLDTTETQRFVYWWGHVTEKGFDAGNPLANLHRGKVGVK